MLPRGARVLCAVSGGADSVCMLHLLKNQEQKLGITVFCAHFEHGIRGEESLRDLRFTEELCRKWQIPFTAGHGDVPAYAQEHSCGIEEAARSLRYAFLNETAERLGCDRLATAHTMDDNAETLLMNLVRGCGAKGLCGIPPRRGTLIRPLLGVSRREIEEYNALHGIAFVEDSTNSDERYRRNRMRAAVLPLLREMNPHCCEAMLQSSLLLRRDETFLEREAQSWIAEQFDGESLPAKELLACDRAVSSRILRLLWPQTLTETHIGAILALCASPELGFADAPGGRIRCEQGRLFLHEDDGLSLIERELHPGESVELPEAGWKIYCEIGTGSENINSLFKTYELKHEMICGSIRVSARIAGDRMRPVGRGGSRSLKQLFTERGLTQRQRRLTPVLRDEKGILAVYGIGIDERLAAQPGEKVLRVKFEHIKKENGGY